jgi:peptidoglycan/LPS O-acetylase OafA/YrhL
LDQLYRQGDHVLTTAPLASPSAEPAAPSLAPPRRRWIYLDVLRGLAILLVLGAHTPFRLPRDAALYHVFSVWKRIGWVGVDLFFVLSGFLIGGLLFAEHRRSGGSIAFGRFFVRRAFKIWPAYLLFLAAAFAWDVAEGTTGSLAGNLRESASAIWPYLVHAQNYYYGPFVERIGHAWSLAVEEHFYLLLPLLLTGLMALAHRRGQPEAPFGAIPWICLGLLGACLGLRVWAWRTTPEFDEFVHHWPTHVRIDSLFVGVALAYGVHHARPRLDALRRWWPMIAVLSLACFAPFTRAAFDSAVAYTIGYTLLAIGSAGLVLLAWFASEPAGETCERPAKHGLATRGLARIGAYSYSIYLWHMPFTVPLIMHLRNHVGLWSSPLHYPVIFAIYAAMAIGLGALMFHLVERPALALRERVCPAQAAPRADAGEASEPEPLEDDGSSLADPAAGLQPAL